MRSIHAGVIFCVLLAGCADMPPADFNAAQKSWHGVAYDTVATQWGSPTRTFVLADGRDANIWVSESVAGGAWYPSVGVFGGSRGVGVGVGAGVSMGHSGGALVRCERTLYFRNGQVVEQSWQGQAAFCNSFRRT